MDELRKKGPRERGRMLKKGPRERGRGTAEEGAAELT